MGKLNPFSKPFIYIGTVIYIIAGFSTLSWGDKVADFVLQEDHFFEDVGALSFFAASALFVACYILSLRLPDGSQFSRIKQVVFLGLALLFFFAGGEEISWGQRILHVQASDEILAINQQGEVTVHNLKIFERAHFSFETVFDAFWVSFTLLLPLVATIYGRVIRQFIPVPHLGTGLLFLFNYLWAKVAKLIYVTKYTFKVVPFVQAVQEIKESNYALLFALVALYMMLQLLRLRAVNPKSVSEIQGGPIDDASQV